jgi:5-methylcytosine-specific restriction endonuclease McrA
MIYKTRAEAIMNGGLFYFGRQCLIHDDWKRSVNDCKCIKCKSENTLKNRNPETHKQQALKSYHARKKLNSQKIAEKRKEYYINNKATIIEKSLAWQKENKLACRAKNAKRRASKLLATPPWAKNGEYLDQIKTIYKNCPAGHEVDHIVPLKGVEVCGLHVPWNLQYLTKSQNSSKGNRLQ